MVSFEENGLSEEEKYDLFIQHVLITEMLVKQRMALRVGQGGDPNSIVWGGPHDIVDEVIRRNPGFPAPSIIDDDYSVDEHDCDPGCCADRLPWR